MKFSALGEFMPKGVGSINPKKFPDETFELFSIPAFDEGVPEVLKGQEIGSAKKIVIPQDVLLSKIVPHIRRCWVVSNASTYRQIASGEWIQFRSNNFAPQYLKHFLTSDPFHSQFMRTVTGVGGSLLRARPSEVAKIKIPLPPLDDQKRIAYLLSKVEGLIARRKQHLQYLDDLLKSVFLEMFGDPVRNEKGWETNTLGNLASSFKYGTNVKSNDDASNGFPVLRIPNVVGGKINLENMKYSCLDESELEKTQLITGDLLLVRTNGNPEYIGRSAVFNISESIYAYASYLIRVRLNSSASIRPDFLNFVINFSSYRSSLISRAKTTAGNYNINTASLKTLIIPNPPIELQNQFATIVEKVEGIKTRYQASLTDLENLYGALSQKAFKGELDLSRVPLPQPPISSP